jgi:hypothetical protein
MIIPKFLLQRLWVKGSFVRTSLGRICFKLENPFLVGHLTGIESLTLNGTSVDLTTLTVSTDVQGVVSADSLTNQTSLKVAHKQVVVFEFGWEAPVRAGKIVVALTAVSQETGVMHVSLEETLAVAV